MKHHKTTPHFQYVWFNLTNINIFFIGCDGYIHVWLLKIHYSTSIMGKQMNIINSSKVLQVKGCPNTILWVFNIEQQEQKQKGKSLQL